MAYIPPHKRHVKNTERPSPTPSLFIPPRLQRSSNPRLSPERKKDKQQTLQGRKFIYAKHSISRCCIVGSADDDDDQHSTSVRILPTYSESMERKSGEKQSISGEMDENMESFAKINPLVFIADKLQADLLASFQNVRNATSSEESEEVKAVKPSFEAIFGEVIFPESPSVSLDFTSKSSAAETALGQAKRLFFNYIPISFAKDIVDGVIPKIEVDFDEEKDYYRLRVIDKSQPEATISCKCSAVKAGGEHELQLCKIKLSQVRHLVLDVLCLNKDLDLRLMLQTKRILTALTDEEQNSLTNLIKSAVIDPDVKGGLRWPLGKYSSDRYYVAEVLHTKDKYFKNSSMRLKLRYLDRFDFSTSTGAVAGEVSLKMTEINRELRDGMVEQSLITDMLQGTLKLIWDHFLCLSLECPIAASQGTRTSSSKEDEEIDNTEVEASSLHTEDKEEDLQGPHIASIPQAIGVVERIQLSQEGLAGDRLHEMHVDEEERTRSRLVDVTVGVPLEAHYEGLSIVINEGDDDYKGNCAPSREEHTVRSESKGARHSVAMTNLESKDAEGRDQDKGNLFDTKELEVIGDDDYKDTANEEQGTGAIGAGSTMIMSEARHITPINVDPHVTGFSKLPQSVEVCNNVAVAIPENLEPPVAILGSSASLPKGTPTLSMPAEASTAASEVALTYMPPSSTIASSVSVEYPVAPPEPSKLAAALMTSISPSCEPRSILPFFRYIGTAWAQQEQLKSLCNAAREFVRLVEGGLLDDTTTLDLRVQSTSAAPPIPVTQSTDFEAAIKMFPWFLGTFPQHPRFPPANDPFINGHVAKCGVILNRFKKFVKIHISIFCLYEVPLDEVVELQWEVDELANLGFNCSIAKVLLDFAFQVCVAREGNKERMRSLERIQKEKEVAKKQLEEANTRYAQQQLGNEIKKEEVKKEKQACLDYIAKQKEVTRSLEEEISTITSRIEELQKQRKTCVEAREKTLKEEGNGRAKLERLEEKLKGLEETKTETNTEVMQLEEHYNEVLDKLKQLQQEIFHFGGWLEDLVRCGYPVT